MADEAERVCIYPYSVEEARRRDEIALWRVSHQENIRCKAAIEEAVRQHFDGSHLDNDCLDGVLREFGCKRTAWVLANTLQQLEWDGRFSPRNKAWAETFPIPWDKRHGLEFVVTSHPAILDGVVDQYRKIYQALGLFDAGQCEPNSYSSLAYEGKILVLAPDVLKESCWTPQNQLWYAHDGFGCRPNAIGRSIRSTCLGDGEMTRWNRADFTGVLKEEFLPDWAKPKLALLRSQAPQAGDRCSLERELAEKINEIWGAYEEQVHALTPEQQTGMSERISMARFHREMLTGELKEHSMEELGVLKENLTLLGTLCKNCQSDHTIKHCQEIGNMLYQLWNRGHNTNLGESLIFGSIDMR